MKDILYTGPYIQNYTYYSVQRQNQDDPDTEVLMLIGSEYLLSWN